jgi:hypothetical protein
LQRGGQIKFLELTFFPPHCKYRKQGSSGE